MPPQPQLAPRDSSGAVLSVPVLRSYWKEGSASFPGERRNGVGLPIFPSFPHTQLPPDVCAMGENPDPG